MKFSFIIPVYNGEKYIGKCLDSILCQTAGEFEIIVVNDGSSDSSKSICESYSERYPCVKLLNREHEGVSAARNAGIETACGDYICFVDCDDVISPFMLEYALNFNVDYDIAVFRHTRDGEEKLCTMFEEYTPKKADKKFLLRKTVYDGDGKGYLYNAVSKLYKRELLSDIRFVSDISIGEDKIFGFDAFLKAETVIFCDKVMYYCRKVNDSVMHRYAEGYVKTAERSFEEYEKRLVRVDDREYFLKILSMRAVRVINNITVLELCHKACELSYTDRKRNWLGFLNDSIVGKYFSLCDGSGLSERDAFYKYVYGKNFLMVELVTKNKVARAIEYILWKVFHQKG